MLADAKNLLIFRAYLDLTERIFRLPEFDSKVKKVLDNRGLNKTTRNRLPTYEIYHLIET